MAFEIETKTVGAGRKLLAVVLSAIALVAIALFELSPESLDDLRVHLGRPRLAQPGPLVVESPRADPEDLDPVGPAKVRPLRGARRSEGRPGRPARSSETSRR